MPSHASANPAIQQMYINGHFCYAFKFGIVTNGLGIVRGISFYNKDFLDAHPNIVLGKKSDSPDENKSLADSKALIPVLKDFFQIPLSTPKHFWGMQLLTLLKSINICSRKLLLRKHISRLTEGSLFRKPTVL